MFDESQDQFSFRKECTWRVHLCSIYVSSIYPISRLRWI